MRTMELPCFSETRSFPDPLSLYRTRLTQKPDLHASIAISLLSYMLWPNDDLARKNEKERLRQWFSEGMDALNFGLIGERWGHVADIVNMHYALTCGAHQKSRGGSSVGKAIYLSSKLIKRRGAKQPSLWRHWQAYKDVAHLVAATVAVSFEIQGRHRREPFGIGLQEVHPVNVVALMPDFVLGLAMTYEKYGLDNVAKGGTKPMLDPDTVWRIPCDINIDPVPAPERPIPPKEAAILNKRRAGNRGLGKRH